MKTILRRVGFAALVAGALCVSTTTTRALTLQDLVDGQNITNLNLAFHNFDAYITGNGALTNLSDVTVTLINPSPAGFYGINFNYNVFLDAPSLDYDLHLTYHVNTLDTSTFASNACTLLYTTVGAAAYVHMAEFIKQSDETTLIKSESLTINAANPLGGTGAWDLGSIYDSIFIDKDIQFNTLAGDRVGGSEIEQTFFVVPEPTSAALLLLLGGGLVSVRRFRRWNQN